MKKVRYVSTMVVEFDIDEEFEKEGYPDGLNKEALVTEMKSDIFHELFEGELVSVEAEGFIIEDGVVTAQHKQVFDEENVD